MKDKQKILIIRLGGIGDVVFASIISYAIKNKYPNYTVHYLAPQYTASILEDNPYIDKVLVWNNENRKSYKYLFSVAQNLKNEKYDVIFNMNNTIRSYFLSKFAHPKKLVQKKSYGGHWVDDYFHCAKSVYPELECPERLYLGTLPSVEQDIKRYLENYPKPYIMIAPGGDTNKNRAGRIWDIKYWKELTEKILQRYGGTVFVCGSGTEYELHKELETQNVVITSGKYNLQESSALISQADLFISGDTGTLHIASAHNVKSLALLGSTSPDKIKPFGKNGFWVSADFNCKYCWNKKCRLDSSNETCTPCMQALMPQTVFEKIEEIF